MNQAAQFNQLYWQCRRGMLELDYYLIPFMRQRYQQLSTSEQDAFKILLELPDPELHAYLNGHQQPANAVTHHIVTLVREYAQQSDKSSVF